MTFDTSAVTQTGK